MSEKRFTYDKPLVAFSKGGINDNVTGKTYEFTMDTVLDLLNNLNDENEQLQKENNDYEKQFRIINEKLDEYIKTADTYRIPISSLKYGDDLGYFNGVYQYMKKLKKDIGLIEDKNGYNRISCPLCNSCLYYSRQITYPNGEQYFEFAVHPGLRR